MFPELTYIQRRKRLREQLDFGLLLFLGNDESPRTYAGCPYPFRQDSSFLYYFGLNEPSLAAVVDLDKGTECLFGNDPTVEEIVWTGPQQTLKEKAQRVGVAQTAPSEKLATMLTEANRKNRAIHFLQQDRPENVLKLFRLLNIAPRDVPARVSESFTRAVIAQRAVKSAEEIEQIEAALDISYEMQTTAMRLARPGMVEREIAGAMEGIVASHGVQLAFPTIFSIHGETLHNPYHDNVMKDGDIAVNDSGSESPFGYASDITRMIPVGGRFSQKQREIYEIVFNAQAEAITAIKPGVEFRDIHRLAGIHLVSGLKALGLTKGDPVEAVQAGVHTLFFQCGLGHMMGLDTHDMEGLGEDYVGYTETIRRRPEFGWRSLRLARALEPNFVVTVEPGIYFIPSLLDQWKVQRKCEAFINYDKVETYRHFGGVRLEDDILVTETGHRLLGKPIPKTIDEVEAIASAD